jgi:hypothetical protein
MSEEKKKLDSEDLQLLKIFQAIKAGQNKLDWHRDCQVLQYKLMGAGDIGSIDDEDWDKAMKFIELDVAAKRAEADKIEAEHAVLLAKYPYST